MVLVFGGSQGARSINRAAVAAWAGADPGFTVVHVTGERDHREVEPIASDHYRVLAFTRHLGDLIAASDLVVSRAGGSVFEIAAAGRPAILVPYPHATGDHQRRNAEHLAAAGAAIVVPDAELTGERLRGLTETLLSEPLRLAAMGEAARRFAPGGSAEAIADELLELAR
jgi:UDP-N-acetylglucosamine--N-acetylmuramyl-(pentapeptide) pyrophosphoryl-undecaprenol N-acetylglucosamine transferase